MNIEGLEMRIRKGNGTSVTYWKDGVLIGKRCTKCGEDKEINNFYLRNKKKGIYMSICKKCGDIKANAWKKNNKKITNERQKRYYEQNKEKTLESQKRYKEKNKEKINKYRREYQRNNKEIVGETRKRWRDKNKEYIKECREKIIKENIERIREMLNELNPILKDLPIYGTIYKFKNIKTGKVYIGQTIQSVKLRYHNDVIKYWIEERKQKQSQKFLNELIEEDFVVTEVLDVACCQYHLNALEVYYIDKYNSYENGYNNTIGNHKTDDGLEEFIEILQRYNLEFVDGQILKKVN